jgi:uncharacterized protein DUF4115
MSEGASEPPVTGERHDTGAFETCQIVFWRGYFKCAFYAVFQDGEPLGSPFFRCRERSPLQSGAPLEAHHALVELLTSEGWEPATRGRAWYSLSFRRREWSNVDDGLLEEADAGGPPVETQSVASAFEAHVVSTPVAEPEPTPPPALQSKPEPLPAVAKSKFHRQRALLVSTVALVALAVGLGLTVFDTNSAQGQDPAAVGGAQPQQKLHARQRKAAASGVPAARHVPARVPTTIVVTGSRGNSWVEARVRSAKGKQLFAGVVSPGQTVRVTAPVVWITFGEAGNLDVRVNGRAPVPGTFYGTITAVIAHGRVRSS